MTGKATRARHGSYLFQRPESSMWWLRLRSPGKTKVHSLKTPDKATAEVIALPMIAEHKAALLAARPHFETAWRCEMKPGLHINPEGGHIAATERELQFFDASGAHVRSEPNGGFGLWPVAHGDAATLNNRRVGPLLLALSGAAPDRPLLAVKDADDALLETYITHAGLNAARAKEARELLHLFKTTTDGKPLAKATRDDGRKLVAAMGDVKSATAKRKLVPLRAAVNLAIDEGKHTGINPFASVVGKRDDSERRLPFDDSDMKIIRANLHKLSVQDQLLCRFLASTGARLSEAFSFDGEQTESGVRFVLVGERGKTRQSFRRLPLPKVLLPYLPKPIAAPLFTGLPNAASTRLGEWLREIGITDTAKVAAHSYRHRAKDELRKDHPRVGRCPPDVAEEIFGREKVTMGDGYGRGSPVPLLKKWIDKIGGL